MASTNKADVTTTKLKRRRTVAPTPSPAPIYDTIVTAAAKLSVDPEALRARCRRSARRVGNAVVADLGGNIEAIKFGRSWRVRFPTT